jgi:hypothetical protein
MRLSWDYHATNDQFITTNIMLPCGIFLKIKKIKFITNFFIHTCGQIVLCHVATFYDLKVFKIKTGGWVKKFKLGR